MTWRSVCRHFAHVQRLRLRAKITGQSIALQATVVIILKGFVGFAKLFQNWLEEADGRGQLREDLDFKEVANFIVITLNGAATLFAASRDKHVLRRTNRQLQTYLALLQSAGSM